MRFIIKKIKNFLQKSQVATILLVVFCGVSEADWQSDLEAQFEIVETFDQLNDWPSNLSTMTGINGYSFSESNMPVKTSGSATSIWNFYSDYHNVSASDYWIKNHGSSYVWQGTGKSLKMDLKQTLASGGAGPSRFGLYFGSDTEDVADGYSSSGLENSGYKEVYYFYMVKLPNNMFPTDPGTDIWPNEDYLWWSYHKFATMSAGFIANTQSDSTACSGAGGCRWEYGCSYILTELKQCGSTCSGSYEDTFAPSHDVRIVDYTNESQTWVQNDVVKKTNEGDDYLNQAAANGEWVGLEFHIDPGTVGSADGTIEVWMYEDDGTAHKVHTSENVLIMQSGTDLNYNRFFFGGNISYQTQVDSQGLDTTYYVDDFIIHDSRIGPTYFNLINLNPASQLTGIGLSGCGLN